MILPETQTWLYNQVATSFSETDISYIKRYEPCTFVDELLKEDPAQGRSCYPQVADFTLKSVQDLMGILFMYESEHQVKTWVSICDDLLDSYDCKDSETASSEPGPRDRPGSKSQDGVSQQQEDAPLLIPQVNHLHDG